jgi:hypothetical protein
MDKQIFARCNREIQIRKSFDQRVVNITNDLLKRHGAGALPGMLHTLSVNHTGIQVRAARVPLETIHDILRGSAGKVLSFQYVSPSLSEWEGEHDISMIISDNYFDDMTYQVSRYVEDGIFNVLHYHEIFRSTEDDSLFIDPSPSESYMDVDHPAYFDLAGLYSRN